MMGAAYAVRAMVLQWDGAEAAGYYQAAWTVGGLYVGTILQAMGADFYPRLTGAAHDHALMNRLVNEQTQVGLLLAAPGVIATLAFAPLAILVLYSSEFGEATEVLRWICLGMALRVTSGQTLPLRPCSGTLWSNGRGGRLMTCSRWKVRRPLIQGHFIAATLA